MTDSEGGTQTDHDRLNGFTREHIQRNGETGEVVTAEINSPWISPATATDGGKVAKIVRTDVVKSRRQKVGTSTFVRSTVVTGYQDGTGLPVTVEDQGDDAITTDTTCTRTTYGQSATLWLMSPVKTTQLADGVCAGTPAAAAVLSEERYSFDGGAFGVAPTQGDVTREEALSGAIGSGTWVTKGTTTYDPRGRVKAVTDGLGNTSTTDYTPTGVGTNLGPVTSQVTTNALGHQTTTTFNPARGATTGVTDPNGKVTTATYDALGRLTSVWRPGRVQGSDTPDTKYTYVVSGTTHPYVLTETLLNDGTYAGRYDIYDAMLRLVETQTPSMVNTTDRVVTTMKYNSVGAKISELGPYKVAGSTPSGTYFDPISTTVFNNHRYTYDGVGRRIAEIYQPKDAESPSGWRTVTSYDADRVAVDPPVGGTPVTTVTDVRGNTTSRIEHLGTSPAATGQATTYTYDGANRLKTMKDPATNQWTWTYDLRGNTTGTKDPDKGTSATTFDNNDQPLVATDARGIASFTEYDPLGRVIGVYDGTVKDPAKQRTGWRYDTRADGSVLAKGQLSSSTRFVTPGTAATAITSTVTGYNNKYQPTGTSLSVPSISGTTTTTAGDLAGTYATSTQYNYDGSVAARSYPSAPGLPVESVNYNYNKMGLPEAMGGHEALVNGSVYSPFGELLQVTTGAVAGRYAFQTWFLDEGTRRLTRNLVTKEAVAANIVNANYTYDPAGNVKQVADGTTDLQCFNYDYRGQMTEAFTIGSGACPAVPSTTTLGTAASNYWSSFTYSNIGNRTSRTDRVKVGTTVTSTVYTHTYPGSGPGVVPNGATGVGGPHAVSSVSRKIGTGTPTVYAYKYDAAGNMTTRAAFVNTWNSEGRLVGTKNGTAAAATYVYDADGNRLLRRNPDTTTTLYVGDTEITLGTSTTTPKTAQRWYQFAGKTIATRTSVGMTLLAADHHGTGEAQLDAYSASYVTRKFTPFGGTRGGGTASGTASATWRGDHGFLDKPVDATSGLSQVGARYYDNGIGAFISVDPLLDTNDAHQANAYNYARNNPLTYSDPTGLMCADGCGAGGSSSRSYDSLAGVSEGSPRGLGTETPNVSFPGSTAPPVQDKPSGLEKILFTAAGVTIDFKIAFTQRLMRWSDTSLKRLMFTNRARSILTSSRNGTIGKVPPSTAARADLRLLSASKWASRGLGAAGAAATFGLAKADGDGNTEAALKSGISLLGSAAVGSLAGAGCGLVTAGIAAAACAAGGAAVGGVVAGWANEKFDSQIETAAEFVNDTASTISDGVSQGWEASKSFASTVGGTVGGWFD